VNRILGATLAIGIAGGVALTGVAALQDKPNTAPALPLANTAAPAGQPKPAAPAADPDAPDARPETPMADRVAVLGLLNKRNGEARDITLRPGQAMRVGDVVIRLRACEKTGDWENEQLTGAFVQLDVHGRDDKWRRAFSGWLFKESPSLNVVEDPIYDVWPKSCAMNRPDIGPDTILASAVARGGAAPAARSSAKKSAAPKGPPGAGDTVGGAADVPDKASSSKAR
jgi:hypothetical protein